MRLNLCRGVARLIGIVNRRIREIKLLCVVDRFIQEIKEFPGHDEGVKNILGITTIPRITAKSTLNPHP